MTFLAGFVVGMLVAYLLGGPDGWPRRSGRGRRRGRVVPAPWACVLIAAAIAWPAPSWAAEPGVSVEVVAFGQVALTGEAKPSVVPGGVIAVDGPLALGGSSLNRVYTRLSIGALPGETLNFTDVATFRSAELDLGAYRIVGARELGAQVVTTSLGCEWGFSTRMGTDPQPLQRYPRHYGCGPRFDERTSGAWLSIQYGRAESGGDWGFGQWQLSGSVPVGPVSIGGEAVLSVGRGGARSRDRPTVQRDVFLLSVGVDGVELLRRLR